MFFFLLSIISGSLVKLTDDIEDFDIKKYRMYAIPSGLAYGIIMGYLMLINIEASFLFGGIALGCLIAGKIDSRGHYFGISAILAAVLLYDIKLSPMLLIIAMLTALDEIKDVVNMPIFMDIIFEYRLILKFGLGVMVALNLAGENILIALFAFDGAYMLTGTLIRRVFL